MVNFNYNRLVFIMSKQTKINAYNSLVFGSGLIMGHCLVAPFTINCILIGITASFAFMVTTSLVEKLL
jgi:hypothetical protein